MRFHFFKQKTKSTKLSIIFAMLFPFLIAVISFTMISSYNFYENKEQARTNCLSSMQLFSQRCENEIMNVIQSSGLLTENSYFSKILTQTESIKNTNELFRIKNTMLNFTNAHPVVENLIVINKKSEQVISSDGLYTFDKYFNHIFSYTNYSKSYWCDYKSYTSDAYRILSPSEITTPDYTDAVIPVVVRGTANMKFNNLMVINISVSSLISLQKTYISPENSQIYILNNFSGDIFHNSSDRTKTENIMNTEMYTNLLNNQSFKYNIENIGNCLITTYNTSNNLSGYTYFAAIPYSTLTKTRLSEILLTLLIFTISGAITLYFSISRTNSILTPIQKAILTLDPQSSDTQNVFEHLENAAENMKKLTSDLYTALPVAQEKYLINYLNSAEYSIDTQTQEIIRSGLPFKYKFFAFVILQTQPTKLFFECYNETEYRNIQSGLHSILKQMFSEKFLSFYLTRDKDVLHIILNSETDSRTEEIHNILSEINSLLKNDNSHLNIYIGLGGLYEDWAGLKKSYHEALSNLKYIHNPSDEMTTTKNEYEFLNDAKTTQLYNALISYNSHHAKELIDEFCSKASQDQRWLKQLYTQILSTIFKAMSTRNISYDENSLDFEVYSNILTKSCPEIYKEICILLDIISNAKDAPASANLGVEIVDYINANFDSSNLSLDALAEHFNVQPTYISTLVAKTLGVGFRKYLTNLRISKAKELLAHTNTNIQDIYKESGFYSKPTFFRVFKQEVGVTPSEYRQLQNKQS